MQVRRQMWINMVCCNVQKMKVGTRYRNRRELSWWLVSALIGDLEVSASFLYPATPVHTSGRTPPYKRTVCLVVLSDLLSFPVRVFIQAGALCWSLPELSQGEVGKGACASRSWEAQRSSAFFWAGIDAGWGLCCNVLGRFRGIGQESNGEPSQVIM